MPAEIKVLDTKQRYPLLKVFYQVRRWSQGPNADPVLEFYIARVDFPETIHFPRNVFDELDNVVKLIFTGLDNGAITSGLVPASFTATIGENIEDKTPAPVEIKLRKINW